MNRIWFLSRLWVGGVFAFSGFAKLAEPVENFRAAVVGYAVFPYDWTLPIAFVLPWLELVFGIFLIVGYAPRFSAWVLSLLALSFLVLLGMSFLKTGHLPADCGCFGKSGLTLSGSQVAILDSVNFLLAGRLSFLKSHWLSLDSRLRQS